MRRTTIWKLRSVLLSATLVSTLIPCAAVAETLTPQQQFAFDIYKELVEINTVTATGDTARRPKRWRRACVRPALRTVTCRCSQPAPRKGNLVARLRGTGARKPILLLAHLDVVPANREDWSIDPFKLIEKDGYFYGAAPATTNSWRRPSSPT